MREEEAKWCRGNIFLPFPFSRFPSLLLSFAINMWQTAIEFYGWGEGKGGEERRGERERETLPAARPTQTEEQRRATAAAAAAKSPLSLFLSFFPLAQISFACSVVREKRFSLVTINLESLIYFT